MKNELKQVQDAISITGVYDKDIENQTNSSNLSMIILSIHRPSRWQQHNCSEDLSRCWCFSPTTQIKTINTFRFGSMKFIDYHPHFMQIEMLELDFYFHRRD
jgi:hypothetical protein